MKIDEMYEQSKAVITRIENNDILEFRMGPVNTIETAAAEGHFVTLRGRNRAVELAQ